MRSRLAHQADGVLDQLADHALDVAAVVADLGVLRRFDLDERRAGQLRQPAGDLGLADAGRADHQDVLGRDLAAHLVRQLLPPPAIAHGDRHGPLGVGLADDVAIELGDDLRGASGRARQLLHDNVRVRVDVDARRRSPATVRTISAAESVECAIKARAAATA